MFTDAEKVDIRRHCGFPLFGGQPVQAFGHRFFQHYGTLEFRINNMLPEEETVVRTKYLERLALLEDDIVDETRQNLDTHQAAVWTHNPNEQRDREKLYKGHCKKLCEFLGVPVGERFSTNSVRVIV